MSSDAPQAASRKPRVDARRERNRQRLIAAVIELTYLEGAQSLNVAAIARRANVDRSRFYALFADVHACEKAAAKELRAHLVKAAQAYAEHDEAVDVATRARRIAAFLGVWMERPEFGRLVLRARHEPKSAFGATTAQVMSAAQQAITALLMDIATQRGIRGRHLPEVERLARLCIGVHWTGFEALMQGTETDVQQVALSLARADDALIQAEFSRMRAEDAS